MVFRRPHLNLGYLPDHPEGVNGLAELIEFNAAHNPDSIFCLQTRAKGASPCQITFAELQAAVERCCAWLLASGSTNSRDGGEKCPAPVGVLLGSDITIFIYTAALLRLGTPVLCLSARLTPIAIAHLLKITSASTVLINKQVLRISKETSDLIAESGADKKPSFLEALGYEDFLDNEHPAHASFPVPPAYVYKERHELGAVIMHSSGTTGLPKPVYHSPSYHLVYAACHRMPQQIKPFAYNVSTVPLYHGFGLLAPSLALSIGMPCVLPPASIIPTARSTLSMLTSTKARFMMTVPSILEDILIMKEFNALPVLQSLDFVATGGAPMKERIGAELVANGVKLLNNWGTIEIGVIALIQPTPPDYDWHYVVPRDDICLKFELLDASTRSYRLVGHPHGWNKPFYVQDLLVRHPTSQTTQIRILGRTDDLIVLATGEKVLPTALEKTAAEHPAVKDVLAFGDARASLGLLVEISEAFETEYSSADGERKFLKSFEPYIERGNTVTDSHGKISMNMIVITQSSSKPLLRTAKYSLARKANYAAFKEEIKQCYDRAELVRADPLPVPKDDDETLRKAIRTLILSCSHGKVNSDFISSPEGDSVDFFEVGMDSLQATRLRRSLQSALGATSELPLDFVFQNSSVDKLTHALANILSGGVDSRSVDNAPLDRESRRIGEMLKMVERYIEEIKVLRNLSSAAHARSANSTTSRGVHTKVVLLTGSTGSLGCMLLSRFVADSTIDKIFCLNRPRDGAHDYQVKVMKKRGIVVKDQEWRKIVFLGANASQVNLGLDAEQYEDLLSVTHIVHNAWPVDFNRSLSSLESQIKIVCNLVHLCLLSAAQGHDNDVNGTEPKRLLFASTITVVGRYPTMNLSAPVDVPEVAVEPHVTETFGYPEAKWVCEQILLEANELFGVKTDNLKMPLLRTSSVRLGQLTGPEQSGTWNETEHFPIVVRTSQMIKALPDIEGTLSWMPVNRAAAVIAELLFSSGFQPIYHMENPSRQSWRDVLEHLASILNSNTGKAQPHPQPLPIIPFATWLSRVQELGNDHEHNYAMKVMPFLESDFIHTASGVVTLGMTNAKLDSPTLASSTALDRKHLEEYCDYWRKQRFLM